MADRIIPENWKEWKIEKKIGEGTYGTVYLAKKETEAGVIRNAIKIIEIPGEAADMHQLLYEFRKEEYVRMYYRQMVDDYLNEIKIMNRLKGHENIVSIDDYLVEEKTDSIGWTIYIRMEYLKSFSDYYLEEKLTEQDILRMGIDICTALESCVDFHIVHRDIKPDNIFVSERGDFKLGDFGVAKQADRTLGSFSAKGTFSYMAPEVYRGEKYGATADIYSLGITLYKLLNKNRDPFVNTEKQIIYYKDRDEALTRRMKGESLPNPVEASRAVAEVLKKATEFQPKDRYQTASEFKKALKTALRKVETGNGKRRSVIGIFRKVAPAAAAGAAAAAIAVSLSSPRVQEAVIQEPIAKIATKLLETVQSTDTQKPTQTASLPSEGTSGEGAVAANVSGEFTGYDSDVSDSMLQTAAHDGPGANPATDNQGQVIPGHAVNAGTGILESEGGLVSPGGNGHGSGSDGNNSQGTRGGSSGSGSDSSGTGDNSSASEDDSPDSGDDSSAPGNDSSGGDGTASGADETIPAYNNLVYVKPGNSSYTGYYPDTSGESGNGGPSVSNNDDVTIQPGDPIVPEDDGISVTATPTPTPTPTSTPAPTPTVTSPSPHRDVIRATPTPTITATPTPPASVIITTPGHDTGIITIGCGGEIKNSVNKKSDKIVVTMRKTLKLENEPSGEDVTWHSENEEIASTIDNLGTIKGKRPGNTTIIADYGDGQIKKYPVKVQRNVFDARINKEQARNLAQDNTVSFIPYGIRYDGEKMCINGYFVNKSNKNVTAINQLGLTLIFHNEKDPAVDAKLFNIDVKIPKKRVIPYTLTLNEGEFIPNLDLRTKTGMIVSGTGLADFQ